MHNPTNMAKFIKIVENLNYIFIQEIYLLFCKLNKKKTFNAEKNIHLETQPNTTESK